MKSFIVRKRILVGDKWREPGEPVPEAAQWFRYEHLVHAGFIVETEVSDEAYKAEVLEYSPQEARQLLGEGSLSKSELADVEKAEDRKMRKDKKGSEPAEVEDEAAKRELERLEALAPSDKQQEAASSRHEAPPPPGENPSIYHPEWKGSDNITAKDHKSNAKKSTESKDEAKSEDKPKPVAKKAPAKKAAPSKK